MTYLHLSSYAPGQELMLTILCFSVRYVTLRHLTSSNSPFYSVTFFYRTLPWAIKLFSVEVEDGGSSQPRRV